MVVIFLQDIFLQKRAMEVIANSVVYKALLGLWLTPCLMTKHDIVIPLPLHLRAREISIKIIIKMMVMLLLLMMMNRKPTIRTHTYTTLHFNTQSNSMHTALIMQVDLSHTTKSQQNVRLLQIQQNYDTHKEKCMCSCTE